MHCRCWNKDQKDTSDGRRCHQCTSKNIYSLSGQRTYQMHLLGMQNLHTKIIKIYSFKQYKQYSVEQYRQNSILLNSTDKQYSVFCLSVNSTDKQYSVKRPCSNISIKLSNNLYEWTSNLQEGTVEREQANHTDQ